MTLNEQLLDQIVDRAIFLQKYGNGLSNIVLKMLERIERSIEAMLLTVRGPVTRSILEAKLVGIRQLLHGNTPQLEKLLRKELTKLVKLEAEFAAGQIKTGLIGLGGSSIAGVVTRPDMAAIISGSFSRPFQGRLLREWMSELEKTTAARIRNAVRIGFADSEGIDAIVRRVVGTRAANYKDGIMIISRRNAESIVRTAINHMSNHARQKAYEGMANLLTGLKWTATLDSRTSPTCQALDGKVFPVKSGRRPPAHIGCRSVMVPIVKGADALGLPPTTRASIDGQVPRDLKYGDWLRNKGAKDRGFVEKILGPKRAKLFLDGDLKIDRFVNPRGQSYTLDQLEKRFPSAWSKAGLDPPS